jgi:hypothetical protein
MPYPAKYKDVLAGAGLGNLGHSPKVLVSFLSAKYPNPLNYKTMGAFLSAMVFGSSFQQFGNKKFQI